MRNALFAVAPVALVLGGLAATRDDVRPRTPSTVAEAQARDCLNRGPTPLGAPVTDAERAAVPNATRGNAFVSIGSRRSVVIIDLATGERTTLDAGVANAHEVAVSPDGKWGVVADIGGYTGDYNFDGNRLAVFDLAAKRLARVIDLGQYIGPHDLVFTTPNTLLVTTQTTQHVVEVNVATGEILGATETRSKGAHTLAVSVDGRMAFTANQPEGTFSVLDIAQRRFIAKHKVRDGEAEGIFFVTADGREVWLGFEEPGEVRVVRVADGAPIATLPGFRIPNRMTISRDGRSADHGLWL